MEEKDKQRRLFLSRQNFGKAVKKRVIEFFNSHEVTVVSDDFMDLSISDSFLKSVSTKDFQRKDYFFDNAQDFQNFIEQKDFQKYIFFSMHDFDCCGLLKIDFLELKSMAAVLLHSLISGGYFIIYSLSGDEFVVFDFEEEEGYTVSLYHHVEKGW